jgi:Holliday junction resolvase RusA-like endonuclease
MSDLTFTVPWSALCSDNRKFISGQFILSKEYRESKQAIGLLSVAAARKAKWVRAEGPLALEVVVREPDRRRRDLNWAKNAKDGITAGEGVWWDDSQVRWELWRFSEDGPPDKATAGATVTIRTLDGFKDIPDIGVNAQPPRDPTMGRSRELQRPAADGLQRSGRVRRRPAAADEPVGPAPGGTGGGREPSGASRQRRTGRAVTGREDAPEAQARPVRAQAQAPRASHRDESAQ